MNFCTIHTLEPAYAAFDGVWYCAHCYRVQSERRLAEMMAKYGDKDEADYTPKPLDPRIVALRQRILEAMRRQPRNVAVNAAVSIARDVAPYAYSNVVNTALSLAEGFANDALYVPAKEEKAMLGVAATEEVEYADVMRATGRENYISDYAGVAAMAVERAFAAVSARDYPVGTEFAYVSICQAGEAVRRQERELGLLQKALDLINAGGGGVKS